jgi:hypothetical protein
MEANGRLRLEDALARTEADAEDVLKAAAAVTKSLKRFRAAAHVGNLRELRPAIDAAERALAELGEQLEQARVGWDFDEETYFANGLFPREVLDTAERKGVRIFEQDERLYCYPSLIRVLPGDRSVMIDKARERRVRPSVLVEQLRELQRRPARFKPEAFLESLFSAYASIVAKYGKNALRERRVERLGEVYELLTLLPGQSREYPKQEFGRDVYLLDRSGVTTTRKGFLVSFPASTGTRSAAGTIRVITERGQEKVYYGISFAPAE